jgi:hypothetical protein
MGAFSTMIKPLLITFSLCSFVHSGTIDSSLKIPTHEHLKYTFGNHKNHPVQKQEEQQYLRALAPMSEEDIRTKLRTQGYNVHSLTLRDQASELIYQAQVSEGETNPKIVFINPKTGTILKTKEQQ